MEIYIFIFVCLFILEPPSVSSTTEHPPLSGGDCGGVGLLDPVSLSVSRPKKGWVLCHLTTTPGGDKADTPCRDLLVELRGGLNAERLFESGNTVDLKRLQLKPYRDPGTMGHQAICNKVIILLLYNSYKSAADAPLAQ